jgi:hypothetical protein
MLIHIIQQVFHLPQEHESGGTCEIKRLGNFSTRQNACGWTQAGQMKKSFPLHVDGLKPPRVVAAIKNDVRKYVKRERRKPLAEGVDFWDFNCKVGQGDATPEPKHLEEIIAAIDQAAAKGCASVYIEILAAPGHRKSKGEA